MSNVERGAGKEGDEQDTVQGVAFLFAEFYHGVAFLGGGNVCNGGCVLFSGGKVRDKLPVYKIKCFMIYNKKLYNTAGIQGMFVGMRLFYGVLYGF